MCSFTTTLSRLIFCTSNVSAITSPRCLAILDTLNSVIPKIDRVSESLDSVGDQVNTYVNVLSEVRDSTSHIATALPQIHSDVTNTAHSVQTILPIMRDSMSANLAEISAHGQAIRGIEQNVALMHTSLAQSLDHLPALFLRNMTTEFRDYEERLASVSHPQVYSF